ncbi:MAG: AMIN domain-containing protein, partial [Burkholderiales bacterium]|nr:AMIN domain-containing protein [Burkholderiales bacterium]
MNNNRRIFLRLGILGGVNLLVNKVQGDTLSDLVESIKKNSDIIKNNQIIDIRMWSSNIYTRLTIETESEIRAKCFTLSDPTRLVVDVKGTQLNNVVKTLKSQVVKNDPVIDNVKVGQFSKTTVRVVIFLKVPVRVQSQILEPVKFGSVNYKYRYLLDIYNSKEKNLDNQNMDDDLLASLQLDSESIDNIKR